MKLPSSPIVGYSIVYGICLLLATCLHFLFVSWIASPLYRLYLIDLLITCLLFVIGNYLFLSNNIYDLHWPLLPLLSSVYLLSIISWKCSLVIFLVFIWAFHLSWQNLSSIDDMRHEDWRYKLMRKDYSNHFPLFAFVALHLLPMCEVLLGSSTIYHIYRQPRLTTADFVCFAMMFFGVMIENLADRQMNEFRRRKSHSRDTRFAVLADGLWKYSRHPNYLGELTFWWALFFLGWFAHAPVWYALGPLLITLMMYFGSIPMAEERLYRKYPEYKFVQQKIPKLIPKFGLFNLM